ncbi:hypothetical protein HELRODRAFT_167936 [Helobdella robusta]|uniref:Uncharacterized protein n=1 Tax=Helobdella robusta TaxID=6412 RepID=T1EZZ5_HELRO|nr:hypothetical protein HELRODRAFT_167936 [Helobdella robusta]ESO10087.1 hypothetical protein HELRODRAFT_167936 [Helobdella robusta]
MESYSLILIIWLSTLIIPFCMMTIKMKTSFSEGTVEKFAVGDQIITAKVFEPVWLATDVAVIVNLVLAILISAMGCSIKCMKSLKYVVRKSMEESYTKSYLMYIGSPVTIWITFAMSKDVKDKHCKCRSTRESKKLSDPLNLLDSILFKEFAHMI